MAMAQTYRRPGFRQGKFDHAKKFEDKRTFERDDKRAALPRISLEIVDLDQSQSNGADDWYCDARS
jgi:hypothetical protein